MSKTKTTRPVPKIVQNDPYLEPHSEWIEYRRTIVESLKAKLLQKGQTFSDFANGHRHYGLHVDGDEWVFREWAPNATDIYLVGQFTDWHEDNRFRLKRLDDNGTWEIRFRKELLKHLDYYKLSVHWHGGHGTRIPSYANYVVQDPHTHLFCAQVWYPETPYVWKHSSPALTEAPLIYEAHVGMAQIEGKVSSYDEFRIHTLPRIKRAGYNTVQLMAVQEHPYYGSFGYQVSNFFAASSRSGTPDELKHLIDEAHGMGLRVIMDIVHSHAVKNQEEGLGLFDGTTHQYFHAGGKGLHPAWDTMCFDYSKPQVLHFLLSNCKYWIEDFQFDGYRFDGVTSMLYTHHGLGHAFMNYSDYFNFALDRDAEAYFILSNDVIHTVKPNAITIAEDMSGLPGLALPFADGGLGFDYRLGMGIPDFWIRHLKTKSDDDWQVEGMFYELTNRRKEEKIISYAESHDQALVGDKTIIFWLIDADMYWHMSKQHRNLMVDRGMALHKLIRLMTIATARGGYLNFMGNEFGHPEWIDFPREGNGWSYHHARRQWHLMDDTNLCYHYLADFDRAMINIVRESNLLQQNDPGLCHVHCDDHVVVFERANLLFAFNFHPSKSFPDYTIRVPNGDYRVILNSDSSLYGGHARVQDGEQHHSIAGEMKLYLPARTALVMKREKSV